MNTFVRAVISGFGFTLGKTLFEKLRDRYMPEEAKSGQTTVVDGHEIADLDPDDGDDSHPECRHPN